MRENWKVKIQLLAWRERNLEGENPTPSVERDLKARLRSMVFLGKWLEEENGVCPEVK